MPGKPHSELDPATKQYFHDDLVLANRTITKAEKEYLKPKNLTIAKLPSYKKSLETKQEEYHILVVVGLSLAEFVSPEKHPVEFLAKFLSSWSAVGTGGSETSVQTSLL